MKYELDTTVPAAVAAYLDAEHYVFLHNTYFPLYEVLEQDGLKLKIRQTWSLGSLKFGNYCTTEYVPPARFLNYDLKPCPVWWPSIHHLIKVSTDQHYYPTPDGQNTYSEIRMTIDMPFFIYPFRKFIQKKLEKLKWEKDQEDLDMVHRRAEIFGRGNIKAYLPDHQFMLHKDTFVKHFGNI